MKSFRAVHSSRIPAGTAFIAVLIVACAWPAAAAPIVTATKDDNLAAGLRKLVRNTITLGAGTYQLTIAGTGETASSGDATIGDLNVSAPASGRNTLTVQGAGAGSTTIQQTSGTDRIFDAHPVNLAEQHRGDSRPLNNLAIRSFPY